MAHLNHGWRGVESDEDAHFVEMLAKHHDLPFIADKAPVFNDIKNQGGRENLARKLRYEFFNRAAEELNCQKIALAHSSDDNAETLLINLLRGSGKRGLSGIPAIAKREKVTIIRPMIELSRARIEEYCRENNLQWREDRTNDDVTILRNRIRHQLLPLLEKDYNPKIREALARLSEITTDEENWTQAEVEKVYAELNSPQRLALDFFKQTHIALLRRVVRMWLTELRPNHYPPSLKHVDQLIHFMSEAETNSLLHSLDSLVFKKTREHIELVSSEPGKRLKRE